MSTFRSLTTFARFSLIILLVVSFLIPNVSAWAKDNPPPDDAAIITEGGDSTETRAQRILPALKAALQKGLIYLPAGTKLLGIAFDAGRLTLNLSAEALGQGAGPELEAMLHDFVTPVINLNLPQFTNLEFYFLIEGQPLHEVFQAQDTQMRLTLAEDGAVIEAAPALSAPAATGPLAGRKIAVSAGHGWYFNETSRSWKLARGLVNGIQEDFVNAEITTRLITLLVNAGATVYPLRDPNLAAPNGVSGHAGWEEGAAVYTKAQGAPASVWNVGVVGGTMDVGEKKDLNSRPLYANWRGADILINLHNNAGGGDGTEIWYDTNNGYQVDSKRLADSVFASVITRLRADYSATWNNLRGVKGSNGGYGENRQATRPAIIVELAFMDTASNATALKDSRFKQLAAQGVYEGILKYYGITSACPAISAWKGEYFNGRIPSGTLVACRNDADINFNWGSGSPAADVGADNFSVRWTRTLSFNAGTYRFHTLTDDGVRLWVDGQLLIDQWRDMGPTEYTRDVTLGAGNHSITMEYYENGGGATARLWWETLTSCPTITGWKGEYFNGRIPSGTLTVCRNDTDVNFNWGSGSPAAGVGADNFSARWARTLYFNAGNYRFHTLTDDGVRLWVDGQLLVDQWRDMGPTEYTRDVTLGAGNHSITMEYYENGGGATARLWWEQLASASAPNLALRRPAYASSQESASYPPANAVDGNTGTRWSSRNASNVGTEWWWVDLGAGARFNRAVIRWERAYAAHYFVGWSDDAQTYYGYYFTLTAPQTVNLSLGDRAARYVAIVPDTRSTGMNNYSFYEVEVYNGNAPAAANAAALDEQTIDLSQQPLEQWIAPDIMPAPQPQPVVWGDVPAGYWAEAAIRMVTNKGIMTACAENQFCPEAAFTSEDMSAALTLAAQAGYEADVTPQGIEATYRELVLFSLSLNCAPGAKCPSGDAVTDDIGLSQITVCGHKGPCPMETINATRAEAAVFLAHRFLLLQP